MTRKRLLALLLVALGACSTQPSVGSRFNGPTALAPFRGFTRKNAAAIQDYIAVTSSRGDEVRLLDPADLNPVVSPGSVFPLSIPTASRPLLLASAAMGDEKGDVLVAASAGGAGVESAGPAIQLIETWDATNRVAQDVSLAGVLAAGSDILCLAGIPASGATPARILVGASGGQLAVVPFTRSADGSGALVPGAPVVKPLAFTGTGGTSQSFDPLDIAVSSDGSTIYVASRDAVGAAGGNAIFGVAQLAAGDIATATIAPLAAGPKDPDGATVGAGTVAVATVPSSLLNSRVVERVIDSNNQNSADTLSSPTSFVYAALDPASCGAGKPIACGIVTIDPARPAADQLVAGSLAVDPVAASLPALDTGPATSRAEAQPYRAPMPIPGVPLQIAIAGPPFSGSQRVTDSTTGTAEFAMAVGPGRNTNAVAMVTSSDGHVYWFDLSRWSPPSDSSVAATVSVTGVTAAATVTSGYQLGLWQDLDNAPFNTNPTAAVVKVDGAGMLPAIDVWPGFTDADTWTLAYQGPLPSLSLRPGLLVTSADGATTYAVLQTSAGVVVTPIADPALGVRDPNTVPGSPGDIVELPGVCEARVAAVLPKATPVTTVSGVSFNGGALQLDLTAAGATCTAAQLPAAGSFASATITVRASGLVLSNTKLGYLGRPDIGTTTDPADKVFSVAWSAAAEAATSGGTRLQQEARVIARKARRVLYPSDEPCPLAGATANTEGASASGCYGGGRKRMKDPVAPGPIIRFRVGLVPQNPPAGAAPVPPRDATISFTTQSGFSQVSRRPSIGGMVPGNVVAFDRTAPDPSGNAKPQFAGHENDPVDLFVPYGDDQVMVFSPNQSSSQVTSIR